MSVVAPYSVVDCQQLQIDDRPPIDLSIDAGSISCIVGAAGSGKSSLLLTLSGVNLPYAGQLRILNQNPHEIEQQDWLEDRLKIAHVLPNQALVSHLTVIQNVMLPLNYHLRLSLSETEDRASTLLDWLGYRADLNLLPSKIDHLQRQIANLARALVLQPDIIFIDEAFAHFDAIMKSQLIEIYKNIQQEKGITVVLATNDLQAARRCTERFIFMADTDILSFASWQSLARSTNNSLRELLNSVSS